MGRRSSLGPLNDERYQSVPLALKGKPHLFEWVACEPEATYILMHSLEIDMQNTHDWFPGILTRLACLENTFPVGIGRDGVNGSSCVLIKPWHWPMVSQSKSQAPLFAIATLLFLMHIVNVVFFMQAQGLLREQPK